MHTHTANMSSSEEATRPQESSPARNGTTAMTEVENGRMATEEDGGKKTVGTSERSKEPVGLIVGRVIEVAIIILVITAVWGLFSLPTVFFFTAEGGNSMSGNSMTSNSSPSCTPEVYTGQFCRDALLSRQQCIPGRENTDEIYIQSEFLGGLFQDQTQIEMLLSNFQSFIQFEPSPECLEMLIPFLCSNIFAACGDTAQLHLPLEQECVSLRDGICMQEWQEITNLQQGLTFLPECETLPGPSLSSLCQSGQTIMITSETQNTSNGNASPSQPVASNITCSTDFYLDNSTGFAFCRPACGQWKPFPDDVVITNAVLVIMGSVIGIMEGVVILFLSLLKYRNNMLKFPSILILYGTINISLLLLVALIGYMDTQTFLCPSQDVTESLRGSTPYCTLFGISIHYLLTQALIFWAVHIAAILWLVAFPFKAKYLESSGHFKIIHLLVLVAALVLPVGFVAAPLGTGGFQPFYYPNTCVSKNSDVAYYALVLPDSILSAIGVSLLVLLFWVLIRRRWNFICAVLSRKYFKNSGNGRADPFDSVIPTTAVIKVIISFLCYTTVTVLGIAAGASLFRVQSQYAEELTEYFICESSGVSEDSICEKTYENLYNPTATAVAVFLTGIMYPTANLLYVLNLKELYFCIRKKLSTSSPTSGRSTDDQ